MEKEKAALATRVFEELAFYQKLQNVMDGRNDISFGEVERSLAFYKNESEKYFSDEAANNPTDYDISQPQ